MMTDGTLQSKMLTMRIQQPIADLMCRTEMRGHLRYAGLLTFLDQLHESTARECAPPYRVDISAWEQGKADCILECTILSSFFSPVILRS